MLFLACISWVPSFTPWAEEGVGSGRESHTLRHLPCSMPIEGNKARCPPASSQGWVLLRGWWPPGEVNLYHSSPPPASSQFLLPLIQFSSSWPQQARVPELLSTDSTNYWGVKIDTFKFWEQTQRWGLKRTEKEGWREERRSLNRKGDTSQVIRRPAKDEHTASVSQNE